MDGQNFSTYLNIELAKRKMIKKKLIEEMQSRGCRDSYSSLIQQFNGFSKVKPGTMRMIIDFFEKLPAKPLNRHEM